MRVASLLSLAALVASGVARGNVPNAPLLMSVQTLRLRRAGTVLGRALGMNADLQRAPRCLRQSLPFE